MIQNLGGSSRCDDQANRTHDSQERQLIEGHRASIDGIDRQLVALLNERARHSLAIRALKEDSGMALYDPKREEQIIVGVEAHNQGPLYNDDLRELYGCILKVMKGVSAQ